MHRDLRFQIYMLVEIRQFQCKWLILNTRRSKSHKRNKKSIIRDCRRLIKAVSKLVQERQRQVFRINTKKKRNFQMTKKIIRVISFVTHSQYNSFSKGAAGGYLNNDVAEILVAKQSILLPLLIIFPIGIHLIKHLQSQLLYQLCYVASKTVDTTKYTFMLRNLLVILAITFLLIKISSFSVHFSEIQFGLPSILFDSLIYF